MKEFHQLEADMLPFDVKARPATVGEHAPKVLYKIYGNKLKTAEKKLAKWMKDQIKQAKDQAKAREEAEAKAEKGKKRGTGKRKSKAETNDQAEDICYKWSKEWWPLNSKVCLDWRDPRLKNSTRDYDRFARSAIIELETTKNYRQDLLNTSAAAAFLRHTFKNIMDPLCAKRTVEYVDAAEKEAVDGWQYADNYCLPSITHAPVVPEVDLKNLILTRQARATEVAHRKKLIAFIQKAESLGIFKATPDTELLDDEIREVFDLLIIVRPLRRRIVFTIG